MGGGRAREIHVVVDIEKLNAYGLSMTQVRDALVNENVEIPGGAVEQGKGQLLLRTLGRVDATEDFNNIVIATKNGTPIRVSDVGYAEDSFRTADDSAVWLGTARQAVSSTSGARWARTRWRSSKACAPSSRPCSARCPRRSSSPSSATTPSSSTRRSRRSRST